MLALENGCGKANFELVVNSTLPAVTLWGLGLEIRATEHSFSFPVQAIRMILNALFTFDRSIPPNWPCNISEQ